ncbi:MAG: YjgP/YjgQ family permease [Flavobacteriaceae bacterium TMED120]|nr:MAG: YjgP/YjgQ family permease [Flavobacteriaceae bacterium TMED120]
MSSYLRRLLGVFAICMIIFIIQTFWLFVDDLAGKGLDIIIILRFLLYYSPKLVPLVLPLSVLLASLMTYGDLAENYEFAAMKSTGISLQRAMRSLIIFHVFLGIGSFCFSNYVIPFGELKSYNLRKNLAKLKPALAIREGIFNDLGSISIKVEDKYGEDNRFLTDVVIHEKSPDQKNNIVIKAENGELISETSDAMLQLVLYNGNRYEIIQPQKAVDRRRHPHAKVAFEQYNMNIDLSEFNNVDLEEENYKSTFRMQKVDQLNKNIDSLEGVFSKQKEVFAANFKKSSPGTALAKNNGTIQELDSILQANVLNFAQVSRNYQWIEITQGALSKTRRKLSTLENKKKSFFVMQKFINLHKITRNDKYTLMFASIILFLIGASLGAIIRKGGFGLPLVLAVIIFLTYHYIGMFGKNAAEDNSISPELASWISTLIFGPLAYFLTRRASTDKGFINLDGILVPINKFLARYLGNSNNH